VALHVAKVAQSTTATWPKSCQIVWIVGPGTFLKQFFLEGCFSIFVFLQGRKLKRAPNYKDEKHI